MAREGKREMNEHPCKVCQEKAADRAIICPALGVINANRCKRIKQHNADDAFNMLYGLRRGAHNTRIQIQIRRTGLDSDVYKTYKVIKGGISLLTVRKPKRRPTGSVGLTSDTPVRGARDQALKGTEEA